MCSGLLFLLIVSFKAFYQGHEQKQINFRDMETQEQKKKKLLH